MNDTRKQAITTNNNYSAILLSCTSFSFFFKPPLPSPPAPRLLLWNVFAALSLKFLLPCRRRTKLSDQPVVGGWTEQRRDWRPRHPFWGGGGGVEEVRGVGRALGGTTRLNLDLSHRMTQPASCHCPWASHAFMLMPPTLVRTFFFLFFAVDLKNQHPASKVKFLNQRI